MKTIFEDSIKHAVLAIITENRLLKHVVQQYAFTKHMHCQVVLECHRGDMTCVPGVHQDGSSRKPEIGCALALLHLLFVRLPIIEKKSRPPLPG